MKRISKEQAIEMIKSNLEQGNSIPTTDEGSGAAGAMLVSAKDEEEINAIVDELKGKEFSVVDIEERSIFDEISDELDLDATPGDYDYQVCFSNLNNNYKQYFLI